MELGLASATAMIFLGLGLIELVIGDKNQAKHYFRQCFFVLAWVWAIYMALYIADQVYAQTELASYYSGTVKGAWDILGEKAKVFNKVVNRATEWIQAEYTIETMLRFTIVLDPLADSLRSASGPWLFILNIFVVPTFLFLTLLTRALAGWGEILLTIGAGLIPVPKLRKIGAFLFSVYLVYAPLLVMMANYTQTQLDRTESPVTALLVPKLTPEDLLKFILGGAGGYFLKISSFVSELAKNTWLLADALIACTLAFSIGPAIAVGLAQGFEGVAARLGI